MLDWIIGASRAGRALPPTAAVDAELPEPPETPAPLFAVRAFKHALFGTPRPAEPQTTRRSVAIARVQTEAQLVRKLSDGHSSSGDLATRTEPASPPRPSGILMTPGAANARKKSVTFGAHVVDNEGKRAGFPGKSGLPNDYPGKFPSPWSQKVAEGTTARSRTRLTKTLYEASSNIETNVETTTIPTVEDLNTSSAQTGPTGDKPSEISATTFKPRRKLSKAKDDLDITVDLSEPRSQSGRYWKNEFESYADKTKCEVERIVKKQQDAKKYAMKKDSEALELATLLRQERQKSAALEARLADLTKHSASGRQGDVDGGTTVPVDARAPELETENEALRRNLARVKDEMEDFTKRREQHEERQKRRETRLESEKNECQERLRQSLAEQQKHSTEMAALRQQIALLDISAGRGAAANRENAHALSAMDIWAQEAEPTPRARPRRNHTVAARPITSRSPLTPRAVNSTYSTPAKPAQHANTKPAQQASTPNQKTALPSSDTLPFPTPDQRSPSLPTANLVRNAPHAFLSPGPSTLHLPSSPPTTPLPRPPQQRTVPAPTYLDADNDHPPAPPSSPPQRATYGRLAIPLSTAPNAGVRKRSTATRGGAIGTAGRLPPARAAAAKARLEARRKARAASDRALVPSVA